MYFAYLHGISSDQLSTEQCYTVISDRTSSVLHQGMEVCPGHWYDSNSLNDVWYRMGFDPIQSQEWVLFLSLFLGLIYRID